MSLPTNLTSDYPSKHETVKLIGFIVTVMAVKWVVIGALGAMYRNLKD